MEITSEMALRELRRRGKLGGVKDRSETKRQRAHSEGTMKLSSSELQSIAEPQNAGAAPAESATSHAGGVRASGSPAEQRIVSSSSAPDRGDPDSDVGEVALLIGEFRNAHKMVSKAEVRELRRELPLWLAAYPYESVKTAIRSGPTVAHVRRLVEKISSRRSELQTPATQRKQRPAEPRSGRGTIDRTRTATSGREARRASAQLSPGSVGSIGSRSGSWKGDVDHRESGSEDSERLANRPVETRALNGDSTRPAEISELGGGSSRDAEPLVIGALKHVEGRYWADGFRSDFIGLGAPFDFTSLRDECAALRRKLTMSFTPEGHARAEKLLSLAARVEEFHSLGLQDAAGQILSYVSPSGEGEDALHAFIGMHGHEAGSLSGAAAMAGLSHQGLHRLQNAVKRESLGRVWLPHLEEATEALESSAGSRLRDPDPGDVRIVSAVAELLGTDGQRQRLAQISNPAGHAAVASSGVGFDVESEVRRIAEPYGFLRVSDAIDELVANGVTTSLPDLQKLFTDIPDASKLSDGWWWFSTAGGQIPSAVKVTKKVAYVAGRPFTGSDLRRALSRHAAAARESEFESIPPEEVLVDWGNLVEELSVDDQNLLYTADPPSDEVLSELELTIMEAIVFSSGGVCSTEHLLEQIRAHGTETHPGVATLDSFAIVDRVAGDVWGLCGAEHDPQIVDLLQKRNS